MKEFQYSFEKLRVFQKSRELAAIIYEVSRQFPADERFGLTSQIRRAALSILSNIAEGSSRISKKEQARFTEIAYSSCTEVLAQTIIAVDLGFIQNEQYLLIRGKISETTTLLSALRKSQADELHEPDSPYINPDF